MDQAKFAKRMDFAAMLETIECEMSLASLSPVWFVIFMNSLAKESEDAELFLT